VSRPQVIDDEEHERVSERVAAPSARQSGARTRAGKKGKGDTWLRGCFGQAATAAARTATSLGERHARIARRRRKAKAQVAAARSILVIIWHLLSDPEARSPTSGTATTRLVSKRTASSRTTFARSRPSASPSPSPGPRNLICP
jgi:hypothetical protein